MFELVLIYKQADKRYTIPFEIIEKYLTKPEVAKIKAAAKKEIRKI